MPGYSKTAMVDEIRALATPLQGPDDLDQLARRAHAARFIGIGEASHGTHEFYHWRAALTRRLIEAGEIAWIGVEGDWPDCWRINQWVRGLEHQELDAVQLLSTFERWPTWMWANYEVADFLTWLRAWNAAHPSAEHVGFYGLDVYSLWDSLRVIMAWLEDNAPEALSTAMAAWRCFIPYREDPHEYAWASRLVPETCEPDVVALLSEVRRRAQAEADETAFDALQNAEIVANAEHYYRIMLRGDRESWNLRDTHMADTIDRLAAHHGAKGLIWEHNTHVGDARATDMAAGGMVNVGQLLRERHGSDVCLIGFATHHGTVLAAGAWGTTEQRLVVPDAAPSTHESLLELALPGPSVLIFPDDRSGQWLSASLGHRAIGVVYAPAREQYNYVPTRMGGRYDALLWFPQTNALMNLRHEPSPTEPELETQPTGM